MCSTVCVVFLELECAPRGGGGRGGGGGRSGGGNKSVATGKRGGYYLHGGLYPMAYPVKETPKPKSVKTSKGLNAWGIIGIVLTLLAFCTGTYYAMYLYDVCQKTSNYSSNISSQTSQLMSDKPRPEENGNGNIPMVNKNDLTNQDSLNNGLNDVTL